MVLYYANLTIMRNEKPKGHEQTGNSSDTRLK